jgi:hypothetical protein
MAFHFEWVTIGNIYGKSIAETGGIKRQFPEPIGKRIESGLRIGYTTGATAKVNIADNDEHFAICLSISINIL